MDDLARRADPETRRALQLDALAAILPIDRRDQLAKILTDDDVATLKHLAKEGMGENSLRALASDLAYLEAWALAATGAALPWPAPEGLALKFVAHHLWDPAQREVDSAHGMPAEVAAALTAAGALRVDGPHAPSTVKRRLASWGTLHRWRGLVGPFASPRLRAAMRLAVRASARPRRRKSRRAVTRDILDRLLAICRSDRLADCRDGALLLIAFGSGGRRRSEIARLRVEQFFDEAPVALDPGDPNSPRLPCLRIALLRTKTAAADDDASRPADRAARRGAAPLARARRHRQGPDFPSHRPMGGHGAAGADAAGGQSDRQAPLRPGRSRPGGIQRPWPALGLSDRSGARAASRCRRRCSSRSTAPSSRRRAITTTPTGASARPRAWRV